MSDVKGKTTSIGKMYGNPNFATGPSRGKGDQSIPAGNGSKGQMSTGPAATDASIGRKTGSASVGGGTKADAKGEDSGGMSKGPVVRGKKGY